MQAYKLFFLLIILFSNSLYSQWAIMKNDADSLTKIGSFYIYNVEFDKAHECFSKIQKLYPNHPSGYFLDAMVDWWRINLYRESQNIDNQFLNKINKVLEICDQNLELNPYDITYLFFKGGALGYRGRLYAMREMWIKAAQDGKSGYDILTECYKIAPGNHDIMLGTGIYNYFAAVFPEQYPILKTALLFLPKGDKQLGLLQLKAASSYARYAATEAKVVLLQIYYSFEKNSYESLQLANELYTTYPNNPYFHRYYGRCNVMIGDWYKIEKIWNDILLCCINKKYGYDRLTSREALYYIGVALMEKREYDRALKYFYKCDEACRYVDKNGPSGFMISLNLKIGQIYDLQYKRQYAIKQYKKVISWKDFQNSRKQAEKYLQNSYK